MIIRLFLLFFSLNVMIFGNNVSMDSFRNASNKYDIMEELLFAIADIESDRHSYAIGAMPTNNTQKYYLRRYLNGNSYKYKTNSQENLFSIKPSSLSQANKALEMLEKLNIDYDLGLMQINIWNIQKRNLDKKKLFSNIYYSIDVGAKILSECIKMNNGSVHDSLECYNKGTDKRKYNRSYSTKIMKKYQALRSVK